MARWTCPSGASSEFKLCRRGSPCSPFRTQGGGHRASFREQARAARQGPREAAAKARAENEAFTKEFLNKAREVFELIDKDDSG